MYIDERVNTEQRAALVDVLSGQCGGIPFEIIASTLSTVAEPRFVPFEFELADKWHGRLKVGNYIDFVVEPIRNPVTGDEEHVRVEHETGFIFKGAEALAAGRAIFKDPDVGEGDWGGKAAFATTVSYNYYD